MNRPVILLDMDGVISNFVGEVIATFRWGITHDDYTSWGHHKTMGISDSMFWATINGDREFWDRIRPYPWARRLISELRDFGEVIYTTSPSLDSESCSAKVRWLRKHNLMSTQFNDFMIGPHKHLMAGPQTILIDDYDANVTKFQQAGGKAILFPQPWNERRAERRHGASLVVDEVWKLTEEMGL